METIKFVVEIDEQYIRDHASPAIIFEKMKDGEESDIVKAFADMIGFSTIEKAVDAGTTEFIINRDTVSPKATGIFEHVLGNLAVLADIAKKDEKEEEKKDGFNSPDLSSDSSGVQSSDSSSSSN